MKSLAKTTLLAFLMCVSYVGIASAQSWIELSGYTNQTTTFGRSPSIFAPWEPAPNDAKNFTVPEVDNLPDLHGDVVDPQLVVYFAGNQYMAVGELMAEFRKAYPAYERIFYVTLPPGILLDAAKNYGGAFSIGNLRFAMKPDVITRGKGKMDEAQKETGAFSELVDYADNELALMVRKGNPLRVASMKDLGQPNIKVSMPNRQWEGIAAQIEKSMVLSGGEALKTTILDTKVKDGTTYLTHIHHRQTPMRIMGEISDVGPVWISEAKYHAARAGANIDYVVLPKSENVHATYTAGVFKDAPHPQAAHDFVTFLKSDVAQGVYRKYGFAAAGALSEKK